MKKRLLALLLTLSMVLSLAPHSALAANGGNAKEAHDHAHELAVENAKATVTDTKTEKTGTVLAFTSDVHNCYKSGTNRPDDNMSAARLGTWIDKVEAIHGDIDVMAFGGDMANASASATDFWTLTKNDITVLNEKGVTPVLTTGNHEHSPGKYSASSTDETQQVYKINTEAAVGDDYRIYCLGSVSSSSSYSTQISSLQTYLSGVGNDKVIFIITHFPLHYLSSSRTTSGASDVIDALNTAVENGTPDDTSDDRTIVFLWGHNHTDSDSYYDQIYGPGSQLQTTSSSSSKKEIKFYYGAAGCMSDSEYGSGSASVKGKGLVVTITKNRGNATMAFTYYNASGADVTESASVTSVDVTVRNTSTYVLAETLEEGKEYIIANGNSGEVRIVSNETGTASQSLKGIVATVTDGAITLDEADAAKAAFTVELETSDEQSIRLKNGEKYLYSNSDNGLRMYTLTSSESTKWWHYNADDDLLWFFKGTSNDYGYTDNTSTYKYYLTVNDNGEFVAGHTANSGSQMQLANCDTPEIYIYVKSTGENVAVTGVTLDKHTDTVQVDKTTKLTATVAPSEATNKKVTWESSNYSVATVSSNGTVTGVSVGTATITVKTEDGAFTDTCTVAVTENTSPKYVLVDSIKDSGDYLIVSANASGNAYALKNPGITSGSYVSLQSTSAATGVTVNSGTPVFIRTDETSIVWHATANSGGTGFYLSNNDNYLRYSSSTLRAYSSNTTSEYWTYTGSNHHLTYSNGSRNLRYSSSSSYFQTSSSDYAVYIYEKVVAEIPATGISLNKNTLTLEAGESETLTATLMPANATTTVTWTSSDTSVATVANGVVTAVAAGTATITASAGDGVSATCAVTVTEPEPDRYIEVSKFTEGKDYIIAVTKDANTVYAMMHNNGSLGSADLTLISEDGSIFVETGNASLPWMYTYSSSKYRLSNDSKYLTINSSSKVLETDTSGNYNLTYNSDKQIALNYPNSTSGNVYYVACTNGAFAATAANATSDAATIRLFEKYTGPVAVTGVSLDKTTLNLKVGGTETLTATVEPDDATNKSVTWSISDETVATVDQTGKVTGVAEGTVTITVTSNADPSKSATCTVTVAVSNDARFELVSSLEDGGEYLIVSANSGSAYALKNPGTSGTNIANANYKTSVTIASGDYILTSEEDIVWTAAANGSGFNLSNNGLYLEGASGNVSVYSTLNYSDRYWTYSSNQLQHKGGSNTYTIRYRIGTNYNYFQGSISGSYTVYLFKRVGTDPVSSVTVAPTTLNLEVGETGTLTATVLPASAANKTVTWSSNNTAVATVENGVVTAVGAGTATITVTTVDGGKTATCVVTVTAPQPKRYYEVTEFTEGKDYIVAVTKDDNTVYVIKNNSGALATGQLAVTSSGTAYIETTDTSVVWKYNGGTTKYLTNQTDYYLNISTSGDDRPLVISSLVADRTYGVALDGSFVYLQNFAHSENKYYIVFSNSTFAAGSKNDSSNAATIRLFEEGEAPAHTHTYGTPTYDWATDNSTCTATAVCTGCAEGTEGHTVSETVNANYAITTAATCTAVGSGTYTATFTNPLFTEQTKDVEIPMVAHTLEHHAAVAASCTEDGNIEYWFCTVCEKYFSNAEGTAEITQAQIIINHSGHAYGAPVWNWNGVASATAAFTCDNCNDVQTVTDNDIASAEGTGENIGHTVYTAEVEFGGQPYTDTKAVINQYTLTFKDGETVIRTITKNYGEAIAESEIPAVPTKAFFTGTWGEVPATMSAEDMIISVQWTAYEGYYLVGINGDWTANEVYEFKANPANPSEYMLSSVILTEGTELKAIKAVGGVDTTWYPAGTGNNYVVDTDHAGTVTVYFSPEYKSDWIDFGGYIYIAKDHTITVETPDSHGTATADHSTASKDTTIILSITPDTGHELDRIEFWRTNGGTMEELPLTETSFLMPDYDLTVKVYFKAQTYTITWKNDDGTELAATTAEYGTTPVFNGETPTKAATADYRYEFSGWTPEVGPAVGDTTYTAQYNQIARTYGEPTWNWTGSETEGWTADTATFTTNDGDAVFTKTAPASVTSEDTVPASCETAGTRKFTATATFNGTVYSDTKESTIPAAGHSWGSPSYAWTETADGYACTATRTCSKDANHIETETAAGVYSVVTEATETTAGLGAYTASFTNPAFVQQIKEVEIPATGYSVSYVWADDYSTVTATAVPYNTSAEPITETVNTDSMITKTATCTEKGETTYTANFTESVFAQQTKTVDNIEALGHLEEEIPALAAKCTETGLTAGVKCSRCGEILVAQEVVAALGHDYHDTVTAPTCTEAGYTTHTCSRCGDSYVDSQVPALGHQPGDPTHENEVPATCTEAGNYDEVVKCKRCGEELSRTHKTIAALGHTPGEPVRENEVAATCSAEGSYDEVVYCSVCKAEISRVTKTIEKLAHTPGEPVHENEVAATCAQEGSYDEVVYCSVCHTELSRTPKTTAKLEHSWDEGEVTTPATCTAKGVKTYTCTVCGATRTEEIPIDPDAHDWNEPTYEWNGFASVTATRVCKNDAAHTESKTSTDITSAITTEPTATTPGVRTYTATVKFDDGTIYKPSKTEEIPATGVTVSGTVRSFSALESDFHKKDTVESGKVTLKLIQNGTVKDTVETSDGTFSFLAVVPGTYSLEVSKDHHVTRTYENIVVGAENLVLEEELEIHLLGDIDGDGQITTRDFGMANSHAREVQILSGYRLACGDIDGDGDITTRDAGRINSHAREVQALW